MVPFCAIRMVLPVIRGRTWGGSNSTLADLLVTVWCCSRKLKGFAAVAARVQEHEFKLVGFILTQTQNYRWVEVGERGTEGKCITLWVACTGLTDVDHSFEFRDKCVSIFLSKEKTFETSVPLIVQYYCWGTIGSILKLLLSCVFTSSLKKPSVVQTKYCYSYLKYSVAFPVSHNWFLCSVCYFDFLCSDCK